MYTHMFFVQCEEQRSKKAKAKRRPSFLFGPPKHTIDDCYRPGMYRSVRVETNPTNPRYELTLDSGARHKHPFIAQNERMAYADVILSAMPSY